MEIRDFENEFLAALEEHLRIGPYGLQSKIAKDTGLTPQMITEIKKRRLYGGEADRRKIAKALGYDNYEDFLNYGRLLLGGGKPEGKAPNVNLKLQRLFKRIEQLDPSGIKAIISVLDALDANQGGLLRITRKSRGIFGKR